jgi:hypothetical protein
MRIRSISILLMILCWLTTPAQTAFHYVLQNPKYYGIENARAWFEISGLKDKVVQKRINDTLRSLFYEKTLFTDKDITGATTRRNEPGKGFTDYTFFNGTTYGNGWIRFKDSDSLLRLEKADGYYGGGMCMYEFMQSVALGKMAYINISMAKGKGEIRLSFSLITGHIIPSEYTIHIDPSKKDSLDKVLNASAEIARTAQTGTIHNCRMLDAAVLPDSFQVSSIYLIEWFNAKEGLERPYYHRTYNMICLNGAESEIKWRTYGNISFLHLSYYFIGKEWDAALASYH